MKRLTAYAASLILFFLAFAQFVQAQGIVVTRPPNISQVEPLTLEHHYVSVSIDNQLAVTKIDQVFANPNDSQLEGTYLFPLADDVAVSDFVLYIDGKPVTAALLQKNEARDVYEGIVRASQDPALLEYVGRGVFQARVFPIPPNGERRIQLEYAQILKTDAELAKYTYPLRTEKFTPHPVGNVAVSLEIESPHPLTTIYSPSHDIAIRREHARHASVSYEGANVSAPRDFVCYYSVSDKDVSMSLLTHRGTPDAAGYFLLLISPKYDVKKTDILEKDFIFVLDRSGSMEGEKIEQAKAALRFCMRNLNDGDRFNLISFHTDVEPFSKKLVPVKDKREEALAFISHIDAQGGTNINDALLTALAAEPDAARPRILVFLTDGEPTSGETEPVRILKNVSDANHRQGKQARIFVFGVGHDVNVQLLDKIAEQNGGTRQYVSPQENLEIAVTSFFTKVNEPVLANLALDMGHIQTKSLYPRRLPDLFRGSQLTVLGRFETAGDTLLTLIGDIGGEKQEFSDTAKFPAHQSDHGFLPQLWAQRKVAYLVDEVRLNGENEELVNEIVRLSKKYGIMTPYTSFLVTEEEPLLTEDDDGSFNERSELEAGESGAFKKFFEEPQFFRDFSERSSALQALKLGTTETESAVSVKRIKNKTFHRREGVWTDSEHDAETETEKIIFGSDAYFDLVATELELSHYLAIGKQVIVCYKDTCYEILPMVESPPTTPMEKAAGTYTLVSMDTHLGGESVTLFPPEVSGSITLHPDGVSWQIDLTLFGKPIAESSGPSWEVVDDAVHLYLIDGSFRVLNWTNNELSGIAGESTDNPLAMVWKKQPTVAPQPKALEKAAGTYTLVSMDTHVGGKSVKLFPPEVSGTITLQPGGASWQMTSILFGELMESSGPSWEAVDDAVHLHFIDGSFRIFNWADNELSGIAGEPTDDFLLTTWKKQSTVAPQSEAMEKAAGTYTLAFVKFGEESVMAFPPDVSGTMSLQPGGGSWQMTLAVSSGESMEGSGPSWEAVGDAVHLHLVDLPKRTFNWTITNHLRGEFVSPNGLPIVMTWKKQ